MGDTTDQVFKEVDGIVELGKWAYLQIPTGSRCKTCPILGELTDPRQGWYCNLRRAYALSFDEFGPSKSSTCPGQH